ncbi:MAG: B12-binding domain-containing radical SAM protein [Endozoicomonas sp.]
MNLLIIKASQDSDFKAYKSYMSSPPQNIFSLAAATPAEVNYTLVDETNGDRAPSPDDFELAVIFASTPDIMRAYELAGMYRKHGVTVVMAGLHSSFLPDEAGEHADCVIIGEAEPVWHELLEDYRAFKLKPRYQSCQPLPMDQLKPWPASPSLQKRYGEWGVLVGRGCRYNCSYCTVRPFFNREVFRPVGHIIDEIKASGAQYLELHADNLCADQDYAMELFTALEKLNIGWSGEATLDFAENEALLEAASRSGLWYLVVGLETCSESALKKAGKGFIQPSRAKSLINRLHHFNVIVDSCLLFGFDEHSPDIFDETIAFVDDIKLDVAHPNFITPFPGTRFHKKLEKEGRLLSNNWADYDCTHVVFQPAQMTPEELELGVDRVNRKLSSVGRRLSRGSRIASMHGVSIAMSVA